MELQIRTAEFKDLQKYITGCNKKNDKDESGKTGEETMGCLLNRGGEGSSHKEEKCMCTIRKHWTGTYLSE